MNGLKLRILLLSNCFIYPEFILVNERNKIGISYNYTELLNGINPTNPFWEANRLKHWKT
jgi:hypothetical protein